MIDGFYSLGITSLSSHNLPSGGGVVVLLNGKIYGGDSSYVFQGTYRTEGPVLNVSVHGELVVPFLQTAFTGVSEENGIRLSGSYDEAGFTLEGDVPDLDEKVRVSGKLISRLA